MAATLAPIGKQQYTDLQGRPLIGGRVHTYKTGTSTPKVTFADSDMSQPNTNPVVLDARGEATIYWKGVYKVELRDVYGNLVWTADLVASSEYYAEEVDGQIRADLANGEQEGKGAGMVVFRHPDFDFSRAVSVKLEEFFSVGDAGALGNDSQILFPTNYQTDVAYSPITITEQTLDAIAINKALNYIRYKGGGTLRIPFGIYRIHGYLTRIDFPLRIIGDGIGASVFRNTDSAPTDRNGYGILCVQPSSLASFSIENMTVDGNAQNRAAPTSEWRSYPLAIYGKTRTTLLNFESKNSPIDCIYTNYENSEDVYLQATNCRFDKAFRNTMSLVSGWNQSYVNCDVSGGGHIHKGTNPRYCLDIEPNSSNSPIKNLKFTNVRFSQAKNVLVGGTWCEAKFSNCDFEAIGSDVPGYPWAFIFGQSQVTLSNCKINGNPAELRTLAVSYRTSVDGAYKDTQYLKIEGCDFYGCGFQGIGPRTFLSNTTFTNSRYPVLFESAATARHEVHINNVTLINVIDVFNAGTGTRASFSIKNNVEGSVYINGLTAMIDPASLPATPSFDVPTAYGISIQPGGILGTSEMKVSNVHSSGYYQKLPTALGKALSATNFRDWGSPNLPPADSAGQTVGPGNPYYRNCTMYGNAQ